MHFEGTFRIVLIPELHSAVDIATVVQCNGKRATQIIQFRCQVFCFVFRLYM